MTDNEKLDAFVFEKIARDGLSRAGEIASRARSFGLLPVFQDWRSGHPIHLSLQRLRRARKIKFSGPPMAWRVM